MWPVAFNLILLGNLCLARVQQQPEDLLDMSRRACEATAGVKYSFEQDHRAGNEQWMISGTARQARSANATSIGFTEGMFRFQGEIEQDGKKQAFGLAYDGERLYVQNPGDPNVSVIEQPTTADLFASVDTRLQMLGMPPLSAAAPLASEPDRGVMRRGDEILEGKQIGRVACELVKVSVSATAPDGTHHDLESTWGFGKEDHLPRMHESALGRMELRDLRVLSAEEAADRASFRLPDQPATRASGK